MSERLTDEEIAELRRICETQNVYDVNILGALATALDELESLRRVNRDRGVTFTPPQWTREVPTREGAYWVKTPCCKFVWQYDGPPSDQVVECGDGAEVAEWLGPIEVPK